MKQDHLAPFREPKSLFLMSGFFLVTFGIFIPIDYVVVEARASGMGNGILQYLVPILNAARFVLYIPRLTQLSANHLAAFSEDRRLVSSVTSSDVLMFSPLSAP